MSESKPFEPARFLTKVNGSEYLEVKWRLVWLRDRHPDAIIETELVSHTDRAAVVKATVTIPGGGSASDYGSETSGDFRDYLEKAATKSIGRALAALGFGTQFTPDHEFGASVGRVVDSPVKASRDMQRVQAQRPAPTPQGDDGPAVSSISPDQAATQRQLRYLQAVAREAGIDPTALNEHAMQEFGVQAAALTRRDASTLIDLIQSRAGSAEQTVPAAPNSSLSERVRQGRDQATQASAPPQGGPSPKQWEYLNGLMRDTGLTREEMQQVVYLRYGLQDYQQMSKADASDLIDRLKAVKGGETVKESLWPNTPAPEREAPQVQGTASAGAPPEVDYANMPSPWDEDEPVAS